MIWIVKAGCNAAQSIRRRSYGPSSEVVAHALESVAAALKPPGWSIFVRWKAPCVFIGNHMSTLETFVLPSMIQPWKT